MREDDVTVPAIDSDQWQLARQAATTLRETLRRAGLECDVPYLRADLNAFGQGYVELGRVAPDTAERLAELIQRGLAFVGAESAEEEGDPT
jgi:hypothetical protein